MDGSYFDSFRCRYYMVSILLLKILDKMHNRMEMKHHLSTIMALCHVEMSFY